MTRIFIFSGFLMTLVSCMPYETKNQEEGETVYLSDKELDSGINNEILFEKPQDVTIDKVPTKSFNGKSYNSLIEYHLSPGDQLDIFLSIKTKQKHAEYKVATGDTIVVNFLNAAKFNETYEIGSDGKITLPIIGEYEVSGNSVLKIKNDLTLRYGKIFKHPDVMVLIPDYLNKIYQLKLELQAVSRGLRRSVTVNSDGYILLPMIGELKVDAKSIAEVSKELNLAYSKLNPSLQAHVFLY